jgi:hypothetical protein
MRGKIGALIEPSTGFNHINKISRMTSLTLSILSWATVQLLGNWEQSL